MGDDPGSWTVLIVDDDDDNISVLRQLMEFLGSQCHFAHDGLEALNMLSDLPVTVILLDLSMPTLDGWEMIQRLRANKQTAQLPVIAVTAHAMAGDKEKALEAGFNGYISKPFMFGDMLEEIRRCVTSSSTEKETNA